MYAGDNDIFLPPKKAYDSKEGYFLNKNKIMRISDSSIVNRMPQVLKRVKTRLN